MCKKVFIVLSVFLLTLLIFSISNVNAATKCTKHVYQNKVASKYLKSDATCLKPAVYYKSCKNCGEKSKETFNYGKKSSKHIPTKVVEKKYLKSAATCKSPAIYYKSCKLCGLKLTDVATFKSGSKVDHKPAKVAEEKYLRNAANCKSPAIYYKSCKWCGLKLTDVATFKSGSKIDCVAVQHPEKKFLKSAATCKSPAVYYMSCYWCKKIFTNKTFTYGNLGQHQMSNGKCKVCGYQLPDNHKFEFDTSINAWVYIPHAADVDSYSNLPVIFYLHGGTGAWSKDALVNPANAGIPSYLKSEQIKIGAIVVAPTAYDANLESIVNYLKTKYSINEKKISVTGHSTGAYWAVRNALISSNGMSKKYSQLKFSACVPISLVNSSINNPVGDLSCAARFVYESSPYSWAQSIKSSIITQVTRLQSSRPNVSYYVMPRTNHNTVPSYYLSDDPELNMNILKWMIAQSS